MLFNSYIFVFAFLPFTWIVYFWLNRRESNKAALTFLTIMSLIFYGYFNLSYLLIICTSICANYLISRLMYGKGKYSTYIKKTAFVVGVTFNIALIGYFKYYDFFLENCNRVFGTSFELHNILLPLGISFFTFQQVSYVIDSYRGETADYSFLEYASFVTFFPQLIAGPIVLHGELIPQFRDGTRRRPDWEWIASGLYIFAIGMAKKVLIADSLAGAVNIGFNEVSYLTSGDAWVVMLAYTLQIYFDFSGYCDMACGIAKMFHIEIPANFNSPYKAVSVVDFWNRWHMTLTRFLRNYIYFPLGGSRKGKVRTYLNIMIVFLVSGIWHGANWTFILWGLLHGIANCLTRMMKKSWDKMHLVTQWFLTFGFVNVAWVIFRADSIGDALEFLKTMFGMQNLNVRSEIAEAFLMPEMYWVRARWNFLADFSSVGVNGLFMWIMLAVAMFIALNCKNQTEDDGKMTCKKTVVTIGLLFWSIMSLSGISTFLYFNF